MVGPTYRVSISMEGPSLFPDVVGFLLNRAARVRYCYGERLASGKVSEHGKWESTVLSSTQEDAEAMLTQFVDAVFEQRYALKQHGNVTEFVFSVGIPNCWDRAEIHLHSDTLDKIASVGGQLVFLLYAVYDQDDPYWKAE